MKRSLLFSHAVLLVALYVSARAAWITAPRFSSKVEYPKLTAPFDKAKNIAPSVLRPNLTLTKDSSDPWIYLPALSLTPEGGTTVGFDGLLVPPGYQNGATGMVTIPSDWDGVSDFAVNLYFSPWSNDSGVVSFFIRPIGRQPEDTLEFDPGSIVSPGVDVPANSIRVLFVQSFTVSGRVLPSDSIFNLYAIQRGSLDETFPGPVILHGVQISYN